VVAATALQAGAATLAATAAVVQQPVAENARAILKKRKSLINQQKYSGACNSAATGESILTLIQKFKINNQPWEMQQNKDNGSTIVSLGALATMLPTASDISLASYMNA